MWGFELLTREELRGKGSLVMLYPKPGQQVSHSSTATDRQTEVEKVYCQLKRYRKSHDEVIRWQFPEM